MRTGIGREEPNNFQAVRPEIWYLHAEGRCQNDYEFKGVVDVPMDQ